MEDMDVSVVYLSYWCVFCESGVCSFEIVTIGGNLC